MYDALATPDNGVKPDDGAEAYARMIEMWFLFALTWTVGISVDEDGRKEVDGLLRELDPNPYPNPYPAPDPGPDPNPDPNPNPNQVCCASSTLRFRTRTRSTSTSSILRSARGRTGRRSSVRASASTLRRSPSTGASVVSRAPYALVRALVSVAHNYVSPNPNPNPNSSPNPNPNACTGSSCRPRTRCATATCSRR